MDEVIEYTVEDINKDAKFSSYDGLTRSTIFEMAFIDDLKLGMEDHIGNDEIFLFRNFSSRRDLKPWYKFQSDFAQEFRKFNINGFNIFHIKPFLCELLSHTDLLSLNIKDLRLPYDNFYIYFENKYPIELDSRVYNFEGCYIFKNEFFLQLYLATNSDQTDYSYKDHINYLTNERIIDIMIPYDIKDSISINDYLGSDGNKQSLDRWNSEELKKWRPYLGDILLRIISSLYYLGEEEYKKDIEEIENKEDINNKNERSTKKHRNDNKGIIKSNEIHKIHLCGKKLENAFSGVFEDKTLRPHWRRGHWRNHAYGPKYECHKKIWIYPIIVHPEKGEINIAHIYEE